MFEDLIKENKELKPSTEYIKMRLEKLKQQKLKQEKDVKTGV